MSYQTGVEGIGRKHSGCPSISMQHHMQHFLSAGTKIGTPNEMRGVFTRPSVRVSYANGPNVTYVDRQAGARALADDLNALKEEQCAVGDESDRANRKQVEENAENQKILDENMTIKG